MLLKNTCDGVHALVKVPTISLQVCKFIKNELLHTCFKDFSLILSYYLIFLEIISWKGDFTFQLGEGLLFR